MLCLQTQFSAGGLGSSGLMVGFNDPNSNLNNSMILEGRTSEEGWKSRDMNNL